MRKFGGPRLGDARGQRRLDLPQRWNPSDARRHTRHLLVDVYQGACHFIDVESNDQRSLIGERWSVNRSGGAADFVPRDLDRIRRPITRGQTRAPDPARQSLANDRCSQFACGSETSSLRDHIPGKNSGTHEYRPTTGDTSRNFNAIARAKVRVHGLRQSLMASDQNGPGITMKSQCIRPTSGLVEFGERRSHRARASVRYR